MDPVVLFIAFGEPPRPDRSLVETYLEEIFYQNANLEGARTEDERGSRARTLAERRAPGIMAEYERIGGSPLNEQARAHARQVTDALERAGWAVEPVVAFQFMSPSIEERVASLRERDPPTIVTVPLYPLCGPSTTVAGLERVEAAIEAAPDFSPRIAQLSGWHRHPAYLRSRATTIRETADAADVDLDDAETQLLFSAHGTPQQYVDTGSRYVDYVEEYCGAVARILDVDDYALGYQNHENRDIPWTTPEIEDLVAELSVDRLVVDPVSFIHEQSETLAELDMDLAETAAAAGIEFHRVPTPHGHDDITGLLADLAISLLADVDPELVQLRQCQCHPTEHTHCLNAQR